MPEATTTKSEEIHHPTTVGNTFMRQYYQFLAKEPQSLHRFYKDESRWCHGVGSHMEEPIAGQRAINEQILKRGYAGARVDLDHGSIDCQASLNGGVLVLVTGVMTLVDSPVPKPFVQTFFLAVQPKGYFVLNDCLRFLELPGAAPAPVNNGSVAPTATAPPSLASAAPVAEIATTAKKPTESPRKPKAQVSPAPVTAAAKKEKTAPSPVTSPVKSKTPTALSPVKAKTPVSAAPASPVKKAAASAAEKASTKDTKPTTTVDSPKAVSKAKPAQSPPKAKSTPTEETKSTAAPAAAPASEPAQPKTWAALFSGAKPASTSGTTSSQSGSAKAASAPKSAPDASSLPQPATETSALTTQKEGKERTRYYSVYIRDVPPQAKDNDLRELFAPYGSIANVNIVTGRGFAFVDFYEQESMRAATAEGNEFKLFDKVLHVDERTERKDGQRGSFRNNDTRGGRGRGHGPKGRTGGDRKERDETKGDRQNTNTSNGSGATGRSANTNAGASNGPRSDRREKGARRGGKTDDSSAGRGNSNRAE